MSLRSNLVSQFKEPHGFLGKIAGQVMARRSSNRERNLWTVELLDIQAGDSIAEIGCGPGFALEACLRKIGDGKIVGIDHSQTMLDQSRARNITAVRDGHLDLRLGSVDGLCAAGAPFDRIFSVNVAMFFGDPVEAFRQIFEALGPHGISATTYMPRNKNPSREDAIRVANEVCEQMKTAGFQNIRMEELAVKPVPAVCVLGERG